MALFLYIVYILCYCERSELSGLFNGTHFLYNYHRVGITKSVDSIIESVDTISRDERDVP